MNRMNWWNHIRAWKKHEGIVRRLRSFLRAFGHDSISADYSLLSEMEFIYTDIGGEG
jgi:hypothetical protein